MSRKRWNVLIALVFAVGVTWIWTNRITESDGATADVLPPAPAVGHSAPEVTLPLLGGGTFSLAELRGTPVVLNFWATWCGPCRAELPELEAASRRLTGQVAIVGINQAESPIDVQQFVTGLGLSFPMPLDETAVASRAYLVRSLPTTFFIDRQGIVRLVQVGPVTEATLAQSLKTIYP